MTVDATQVYAIVLAGAFAICIIVRLRSRVEQSCNFLRQLARQYLLYPHLIRRHRFFGPWSRAAVLIQLCIVTANAFCVGFKASSIQDASRRSARLALLNLIPAYSSAHLSFLADICGTSLQTVKNVHRWAATMALPLLAFHIAATMVARISFSLRVAENVWGLIGVTSLGLQIILSFPTCRRLSYEVFLRLHQLLAIVILFSVWRHLKLAPTFSRVAPVVAAGIFTTTLGMQSAYSFYQNVVLGTGLARAYIIRDRNAIRIRLRLSRPIRVKAGQYIGLWIPGVSFWAPIQSHPFMVTSWSAGQSNSLDIVVQPRKGWTRSLADCGQRNEQQLIDRGYDDTFDLTKAMDRDEIYQSLVSKHAIFTGPHGCGVAVGDYETVVMIASDFGIASLISYLDALLYGYKACKTRNRRIHLVWLLEKYSLIPQFVSRLNEALEKDLQDEGFILAISIQIAKVDKIKELGRRAMMYEELPLEQILKEERQGTHIRRVQAEVEQCGDMAVLVSSTGPVRDRVRALMTDDFRKGVTLFELDYQVQ